MKTKRVVSILGASLLAIAVTAPAFAQDGPPPAAASNRGTTSEASNTEVKSGTAEAAAQPNEHRTEHRSENRIEHRKPKKRRRSLVGRVHDKAKGIVDAIKN